MMDQLLSVFVANAYAESVPGATPMPPQGSSYSFVIMFVIFFLFIYFGVWRPQNKRAKEQQNLLNSLAKGDEVVTVGGVLGKITKIVEPYLVLSVSSNTEIVVQKSSIANVLPKGTMKVFE